MISEALQKMKGKIPEIAGSHVSSRVLQVDISHFFAVFYFKHFVLLLISMFLIYSIFFCQTCVKYCSKSENDAVFEELQPHFLTLASNKYGVHLVKKMLDNGMILFCMEM